MKCARDFEYDFKFRVLHFLIYEGPEIKNKGAIGLN